MQVSETSLASYKMVSKEFREHHYSKIMLAMRIAGMPLSVESIAQKAGLGKDQVSKRMCELERDVIVYKSGIGKTSSGRPCALYSLVKHEME